MKSKVNEENLDYLIESPWKAVIESFCETPTNYHRELTTELVLSEAIEKANRKTNKIRSDASCNDFKESRLRKKA